MHTRVEKSKENKSRAVANSVGQKKSNGKQGLGFVDNRPEVVAQRKLQAQLKPLSQNVGNGGILQRVAMTWENFLVLNEPITGKTVVDASYSNEYISASVDGKNKQVRFGQSFLNTDKSIEYKRDSGNVGTTGIKVRPRMIQGEEQEGEIHISDGHHRAIWCGYHGKEMDVTFQRGFTTGASVKNMTYQVLG